MTGGLPVIIVDDDLEVCEITAEIVRSFYTWGKVFVFTDPDEALRFCQDRQTASPYLYWTSSWKKRPASAS